MLREPRDQQQEPGSRQCNIVPVAVGLDGNKCTTKKLEKIAKDIDIDWEMPPDNVTALEVSSRHC